MNRTAFFSALPYLSFLAGIGGALVFRWSGDAAIRWYAATSVPLFFAIAAIFWGINEIGAGEALIYRAPYTASRARQPVLFWTIILVFRFTPGILLLLGFFWRIV